MVAAAIIGSAVVGGIASRRASNQAADAQNRATDVANRQQDAANRQQDLAEEQYSDWRTTYKPLSDQLARDAMRAGSPEEYAINAERAKGDVTQAFTAARQGLSDRLNSFGVDPSSGKYAVTTGRMDLAEAAAGAGAQNKARTDTRDKARAFQLDVSAQGRGMVGSAMNGFAQAANGLAQATNAQTMIANNAANTASRQAAGWGAVANTAIRGLSDWWSRPSATSASGLGPYGSMTTGLDG